MNTQSPEKDVVRTDKSALRTVSKQTIKTGSDSNSSDGRGLSSSKNKAKY